MKRCFFFFFHFLLSYLRQLNIISEPLEAVLVDAQTLMCGLSKHFSLSRDQLSLGPLPVTRVPITVLDSSTQSLGNQHRLSGHGIC